MGGAARILTAAGGALALGVLTAWIVRASVAEAAIAAAMRDAGFTRPTLKVVALDFGHIEVRGLKAGKKGELSLDRVDARFTVAEALSGKLRAVTLGPGRVVVQRDKSGALSIAGFVLKPAKPTPPPYRSLALDKLNIVFATPEGQIDSRIEGTLTVADGGRFTGRVASQRLQFASASLDGLTAEGAMTLSADGTARLTAHAAGDLSTQLGRAHGVALTVVGEGGSWRDALAGDIAAAAGAANVRLASAQLTADEAPGLSVLQEVSRFRSMTIKGAVVARWNKGRLTLAAAQGPAIEAKTDAGDTIALLPIEGAMLYAETESGRSGGARLALSGSSQGSARAVASQQGGGPWRFDVDGAFGARQIGGVALGRLDLSATGEADATFRKLTATASLAAQVRRARIGRFAVEDAPLRGRLKIGADFGRGSVRVEAADATCLALERARFSLAAENAEARLRNARFCADEGPLLTSSWGQTPRTELHGKLAASNAFYRIATTTIDGAPPDIAFRADYDPVEGAAKAVGTLSGGRLSLNGVVLLAETNGGFSAAFDGRGLSGEARLDAATLSHLAEPKQFTVVRARGSAALAGDIATFRFDAATPDGRPLGAGAGRHDVKNGRGEVQFATGRLAFSPGGLQVAQLLPALRGVVGGATGAVAGDMRATWGPNPADLASSGEFRIENLTFRGPGVAVSETAGLAGVLRFSSLAPLRTDGVQTIRVGRIDLGALKLDGGAVDFSLAGDDRIRVVKGEFPWFGGTIGAYDAEAPLTGERLVFNLKARDVDLAQIFAFLKIDGLSGEGRVEGVLPIAVDDGKSFVRGGEMRSSTPGVIRYAGAASDAAAESNQQAKIAFDILRNLRFERLAAKIDGPLDGDLKFNLLFEGSNDVTVADRSVRSPVVYRIALEAPLLALLEQAQVSTSTRLQLERAGVLPKETVKE